MISSPDSLSPAQVSTAQRVFLSGASANAVQADQLHTNRKLASLWVGRLRIDAKSIMPPPLRHVRSGNQSVLHPPQWQRSNRFQPQIGYANRIRPHLPSLTHTTDTARLTSPDGNGVKMLQKKSA